MVFSEIIIGDSRKMLEVKNSSIDLIVTSPPYWHIKDYGTFGQIGYGQSLHEYLKNLYVVWKECFRVLKPGVIKEKSMLRKEEWKEYFLGHWHFPVEKQIEYEAMFQGELPKRLIKRFTFFNDFVLDPFLINTTNYLGGDIS